MIVLGYLITIAILILIIAITYVLKLRLSLDLQFCKEEKSLSLFLLLNKINVRKFVLIFYRYGKGQYIIKYLKNDKLVETWELKDLFEPQNKKKKKIGPKDIIDMLDMFLDKRRIILDKIELDMDIGLEDAAYTALLTGVIISSVNIALARVYSIRGIPAAASINVKPCFGLGRFNLFFECILSIRLAYIIVVGIKMLNLFLRKKVAQIASDRKHPQDDDGRNSQND